MMKIKFIAFLSLYVAVACQDLDTLSGITTSEKNVITTGSDLVSALQNGYVFWWNANHSEFPAVGLGVAGDAYGLGREFFGATQMGIEPRTAFQNSVGAATELRQLVEVPWYNNLAAVTTANDVLSALDNNISIDQNGAQDQSVRAAAHLLRGLSWGYLGLLYYEGMLVNEKEDLNNVILLVPYSDMTQAAVTELEQAIELATAVGDDFVHGYFNGLRLNKSEFLELCHAYAARFLSQTPRTTAENQAVPWEVVFFHASQGLSFDFAPIANGSDWKSYHQYVFAETGQGPFWARVDQRLVAALDPTQPARYPETSRLGEPALTTKKAQSQDARLALDFLFEERNNFEIKNGEWHFSHYKHHRNINQPEFAGNGNNEGKMPVFMAADNALILAEAALRLGQLGEAIRLVNESTRTTRGNLPKLAANATVAQVEQAIFYERAIELLGSAPMSLWFDRRRLAAREPYLMLSPLGGLQLGTPAQLPVPARELLTRDLESYTFGGENDPEGIVPIPN